MEKSARDGNLNTVTYLNNMGYIILEIQDMYYIVKEFEEASPGSWKHSLRGIDVSGIIENYAHINSLDESRKNDILNRIQGLKIIKKFYHKNEMFTLHFT